MGILSYWSMKSAWKGKFQVRSYLHVHITCCATVEILCCELLTYSRRSAEPALPTAEVCMHHHNATIPAPHPASVEVPFDTTHDVASRL